LNCDELLILAAFLASDGCQK